MRPPDTDACRDPQTQSPPPRILAHRGASRVAPENTVAAFEAARHAGADGIELDVRLSRDHVPMVIHDATLDRTTAARGPAAARTAGELAALDAGSWFDPSFRDETIPRLGDVLEMFHRDLEFRVEIKHGRFRSAGLVARTVIDAIRRHHPDPASVWISSFNPAVLWHCRRAAPEIPTARLFTPRASRRGARTHHGLGVMGVRGVDVPVAGTLFPATGSASGRHGETAGGREGGRVWEKRLAGWRRRGFRLAAWTVDDPALAVSLKAFGFQWIITNVPDRLKNTCNS